MLIAVETTIQALQVVVQNVPMGTNFVLGKVKLHRWPVISKLDQSLGLVRDDNVDFGDCSNLSCISLTCKRNLFNRQTLGHLRRVDEYNRFF